MLFVKPENQTAAWQKDNNLVYYMYLAYYIKFNLLLLTVSYFLYHETFKLFPGHRRN